jgi:hypothetical protein
MKNVLIIPALLAFASAAFAQKDANALKYAGVITPEDAKKHLSVLASDAFEGRETGKPGAEKAAAYIAGEFQKLGLEAPVNGAYLQPIRLRESTTTFTMTANGQPCRVGYEAYIPDVYTDRHLEASEVVFVGYGTSKELGELDLGGKVVVWINEDIPRPGIPANTDLQPSEARGRVIMELAKRRPAAVLAINRQLSGMLDKYRAGLMDAQMSLESDFQQIPGPMFFFGTDSLADALLRRSGKRYLDLRSAAGSENFARVVACDLRMSYSVATKQLAASNVLGFLPGRDLKNEVLVISAHYDHEGLTGNATGDKVNNGADDDASGTTGMIEIARAFSEAKKSGHGPRRSILFLANVGEEKGLLGSQFYVENPVFPLSSTIADLNIDMIGRVGYDYAGKNDSANYVYTVGSAMLSSELKKINETANSTYSGLKLDYKYDAPDDPEKIYYRSDHYNFAKNGIPVIFFTNGEHADYHKPSDEVNKINFPLLVKRTKLIFYTSWELANRDTRPVVDVQ